MDSKPQLLIASRSRAALESAAEKLAGHGRYGVGKRLIENGHADPLWGLSYTPDVLVLVLGEQGYHDLAALIDEGGASTRTPMIVVAENGDAQTMRLAMQAGARDFLAGVVTAEDLGASVERVAAQAVKDPGKRAHSLTAFVNAKGGCGATFIACNVAHISSEASNRSTALLSLDMQFESLAQFFDIRLRHGLMEVLEGVDDLDAVALEAYLTRHESGLRMLAPQPESTVDCHADKAAPLGRLLDRMMTHYDHVVVDMPRRIDPYMVPVLEKASRIVLVVEQTVSHIRDATRMLQIFGSYGIQPSQVLVVVNRFDKESSIRTDDITQALRGTEIAVVPSDFKIVSESINLGVPIYDHARRSAVTKALTALETELGGTSRSNSTGLFGKAMTGIFRKESWQRT